MSARGDGSAQTSSEALCLGCGLCCDGSLFWAVELEATERGLSEAGAAGSLSQPCRHHLGGACAIYAGRPHQCRGFRCRVLQAVEAGSRDAAWAEARIEAMRHLLAGLDDVLPGAGGLYARAAAYLEDAERMPNDDRIRARIAVYAEMIGDFRPLSDPPALTPTRG